MKKEASEEEYKDVIIPLHEEMMEQDLEKATLYPDGSKEKQALLLSAELKSLHIQYLNLHIEEMRGSSDKVVEEIKQIKQMESELTKTFYLLGIDVREL